MAFQAPYRFDLSPDRKNYLIFDPATSRCHLYANSSPSPVTSWGLSAVGFLGAVPAIQQTGSALNAVTTTAPVSGIGYGLSHAAMSTLIAGHNEARRLFMLFGWHAGS